MLRDDAFDGLTAAFTRSALVVVVDVVKRIYEMKAAEARLHIFTRGVSLLCDFRRPKRLL